MEKIKASELKKIINEVVLNRGLPVMVWGAPGIGKTEIISDTVREAEYQLLNYRLGYFEPSDIIGIPMLKDNKMTFFKWSSLPTEGKGVFFFDELTHAKPQVMGLTYQLINEFQIENYTVPEGWRHFIGASNRATDKAISNVMPSALYNRFTGGHYELVVDYDEWRVWALNHDVSPVLIEFIRYVENNTDMKWLFRQTDNQLLLTPRMWGQGVNKALSIQNEELRNKVIGGMIGEDNAATFTAFLKQYKDLPDIDKIFAGDFSWLEKPHDSSLIYIFINGWIQKLKTTQYYNNGIKAIFMLKNKEYILSALSLALKTLDSKSKNKFLTNEFYIKNAKDYIKYLQDF